MAYTFLEVTKNKNEEDWKHFLKPRTRSLHPNPDLPVGFSENKINERWDHLLKRNKKYLSYTKKHPFKKDKYGWYEKNPKSELYDEEARRNSRLYSKLCENFIGTLKIPLGIAGPILVNGLHANGSFFVPLATTEAALVASISRGISVINQCGGFVAAVTHQGINRDPMLSFGSIRDVFQFIQWALKNLIVFKKVVGKTVPQAQLITIRYLMDGRDVHLKCQFLTGEEIGQDLATIGAQTIVEFMKKKSPIKILKSTIDGGLTGEGRAKHSSLAGVRGRRVVSECILKKDVAETMLHCKVESMLKGVDLTYGAFFWNGTIGCSLHSTNAITALNLAVGGPPSSGSESHVAVGKAYLTEDGDLYMSMTLPNIIVGTAGGGAILPSQRACLELMGINGTRRGNANRLAEIMACIVLAGEISLGAAVVTGDFTKAHKVLRGSKELIDLKNDTIEQQFIKSQGLLMKLSEIPPVRIIMEIYGLYKQATVGDINIEKPNFFSSMKIKAKFEAWKKKKGIPKDEAMRKYVELILKLHSEDDLRIMKQNQNNVVEEEEED